MRRLTVLFVSMWFGAQSCGSPAEPEAMLDAPPLAEFVALSGAGQADTIGSVLAPVSVRVQDTSGVAMPGARVRLESNVVATDRPRLLVTATPAGPFASIAEAVADAQGELTVWITLGESAGHAELRLQELVSGGRGAIDFEVYPGMAVLVDVSVADTLAVVGDTVPIQANAWDRGGNRISPGPQLAVSGPATVLGTSVIGDSVGQVTVAGRLHAGVDTVGLGFLPTGRVVFNDFGVVTTSRLDGSRHVTVDVGHGGHVDAAPVGKTAVLAHDRLLIVSFPGGATRVTGPDADAFFSREHFPRYSADEQWIYFTALYPGQTQGGGIWRVRPSGRDLQEITTVADGRLADRFPAPSSDGTRISYVQDRTPGGSTGPLVTRDLESGIVTALGVEGDATRWSPDDQWIAYRNPFGQLWRIRPDGSEKQEIVPIGLVFEADFDWSPDGRYLIAVTLDKEPYLVTAESGRVLRLTFPFPVREAAWH